MIQTLVVVVGVILGEDGVEIFIEAVSNFWATSYCITPIYHGIGNTASIS